MARSILGRSPWFSGACAQALDRLVDASDLVLLKRGQYLCRRGDPVTVLSMVVEGSLEVSQTASAGKRHIATCLEPGQLMNLIPVVDDQPALHDAYAHETARLLLIPKPMFIELMDQEPQVARRIAQLLCRRSRGLYESLSDQALRSLRERCARVLLGLLDAYGRPGEGGTSISLKLSQEDFADMLGCSRQSANRELKQLARDGIIEMTYSSLRVVDEPALRAVALS